MFRLKAQNIGIIKTDEIILYRLGEHSENPILVTDTDDVKIHMFFIETEPASHEYEEYPTLNMWEFYTLARHKGRHPNSKYGYFSRDLKKKTISASSLLLSPFQESFLTKLIETSSKIPPIFTYESLLMYLELSRSESKKEKFLSKPHIIFIRPFRDGLVLTLLKNRVPLLSRYFKSDLYMLRDFIDETLKYGSRYGILKEETEIISLELTFDKINECICLNLPQFVSALHLKWVSSYALLQHASILKMREIFCRKRFYRWSNLLMSLCFGGIFSWMVPLTIDFYQSHKTVTMAQKLLKKEVSQLINKSKSLPIDWQSRLAVVQGREITFERTGNLLNILQKLATLIPSQIEIESIIFKGDPTDVFLKIRLLPNGNKNIGALEKKLKQEFPSFTVRVKQKFMETQSRSQELMEKSEKDLEFESDLTLTERKNG